MIVVKRDGRKERFSKEKVLLALNKVNFEFGLPKTRLIEIANIVAANLKEHEIDSTTVDDIHEMVKKVLIDEGYVDMAQSFDEYKTQRDKIRLEQSELMKTIHKLGLQTDRDNANVGNNFSAKLLRIASETNKRYNLIKMPKHLAKYHQNGDYHIHDLDSYNLTINCLHIPTAKLLAEGFNTGYGTIRSPKRISSAAELICIMLQASQNDLFGGQAHPNFDIDLAPYYVRTIEENKKQIAEMLGIDISELTEEQNKRAEEMAEKELYQAMQAIVYNLNSMHSRAGNLIAL